MALFLSNEPLKKDSLITMKSIERVNKKSKK